MPTVVEGDFERDAAKARTNLAKHGVSFEEATTVFDDAHAIDAPTSMIPIESIRIDREVRALARSIRGALRARGSYPDHRCTARDACTEEEI